MKITGKKVLAALLREGYEVKGWEGSHMQVEKDGRQVTVPMYRELRPGLLNLISSQMGVERRELLRMVEGS